MQRMLPLSLCFKKSYLEQTKHCAMGSLSDRIFRWVCLGRNKNTKKLVNSFLPCRLCSCRVDLCFQVCLQPIQGLSELQQTLHSPLLAFENFSLYHFRDPAVCLIKCPSSQDRMSDTLFLLVVAPEVFASPTRLCPPAEGFHPNSFY